MKQSVFTNNGLTYQVRPISINTLASKDKQSSVKYAVVNYFAPRDTALHSVYDSLIEAKHTARALNNYIRRSKHHGKVFAL